MSIPTPFKIDFPLSILPFNSRVESQLNSDKNYYLVGFKPGFPLQAAELNEMQEIFYVQQTLTQTMFANWGVKQYLEQVGVAMTQTPWNGCTPLDPNLIEVNTGTTSIDLTFNSGWYLVKSSNFNGGLGVWIYIAMPSTPLAGFNPGSSSSVAGDYGLILKSTLINCTKNSPAGTNEDRTLQDSSNINVINGPCGAARMKLQVVGFGRQGSEAAGETFVPIITATATGSIASVSFKNGYIIKQVS